MSQDATVSATPPCYQLHILGSRLQYLRSDEFTSSAARNGAKLNTGHPDRSLAPLSRLGWIDAGRHLLAGLKLAVEEVNNAGGVSGKPLELLVRDTAADATKAAAAVDELAGLGVVALAGEYHSVVARAVAARADAIGLPYLCSSAVLDQLTEQPTNWVARLAPRKATVGAMCDELTRGENRATAVLLLVSQSSTASEIVEAVSGDERLTGTFMGAPAGQPELADWAMAFGKHDGTATPFLRYMPESLGHRGARVEAALREKLTEAPSFVAFEGYDTILVLAELLRTHGTDRTDNPPAWSDIAVDGSRGHISFSRIPGISVWQWAWPPSRLSIGILRSPTASGPCIWLKR
ncbi:hypothetical protein ACCO45_012042 [Purpureocillium lilacinum]|uniref:Uncharacterized protein n=1 Tax=Purpureocillium lilacinum TaxID=33203 RepID=A0ACC4DF66_PURLI